MSKNKKYMIEYLDINEDFYVENDELKMKLHEDKEPQSGTWEDLWLGVREIMEKIYDYGEQHNKNRD